MPIAETDRDPRLKGPLAGVRVIEMGQLLAGPFTSSRLADFGAEVIKVETPGKGDPMREWGHHRFKGRPVWWPILARNKKSVTANLRDERGQDLIRQLVKEADVLVENFKPGTLEKWGLGPDDLHEINPGLIIGRISGYGQTGPYADRPGFASVGEAMSGMRYINGFPDMPPPRNGISLGDTLTGMFAAQGILMALYQRDALGGGKGQVVDAAITESCFQLMEGTLPEYDKAGIVRKPSGTGLPNVAPSNIYPTLDGNYVVIAANIDPMYRRLCTAMDKPELADDPRFVDHKARGENAEELDAIIGDWSSTMSAAELTKHLDDHAVVVGPINSIADLVKDPHFQARDMFLTVKDDFFGDFKVPGFAPKLTETESSVAWLGPPDVGAHNREIYGDLLGMSQDDLEALAADGII
ncbi:MAG: formyl-CoA transferase [Rhodospirillaceae bacterium]|nr:formyl-CoA transferase [Rhodospirillaceae bacterium]